MITGICCKRAVFLAVCQMEIIIKINETGCCYSKKWYPVFLVLNKDQFFPYRQK